MRVYWISIIVLMLGISACRQKKASKSGLPQDFEAFYKRFHSDSLYQMRHISFPLEGKPEMRDSLVPDYRWTADQWSLHRSFDDMDGSFKRQYQIIDDGIIEEYIIHRTTGYGMMRRFVQLGNEWQLSYYVAMNRPELFME